MTLTSHGYHILTSPTTDEHGWDQSFIECGGIPFCGQCTYEAELFVNGEFHDLHRVQEREVLQLQRNRRFGRARPSDPMRLRFGRGASAGRRFPHGPVSTSTICASCRHPLANHIPGGCLQCHSYYECRNTSRLITGAYGPRSLAISGPVDTPSVPLDISLWVGHRSTKRGKGKTWKAKRTRSK